MKNKFIIIVCGDPKSTFIEILLKVLNNKKYAQNIEKKSEKKIQRIIKKHHDLR